MSEENTFLDLGTGATTTYVYDGWGRNISRYTATNSASYSYKYHDKLHTADSTFPGENSVVYGYGADGKRRWRDVDGGSEITWFNWGAGYSIVSEEDDPEETYNGSANNLTRTYLAGLGEVSGSNPATGTARYWFLDHQGSAGAMHDASKGALAAYEYGPYGALHAYAGAPVNIGYTGQMWEPALGQYFFAMRYYSPGAGGWMVPEPFGIDGPNLYHYGFGRPVIGVDAYGLFWREVGFGLGTWLAIGVVIVGGLLLGAGTVTVGTGADIVIVAGLVGAGVGAFFLDFSAGKGAAEGVGEDVQQGHYPSGPAEDPDSTDTWLDEYPGPAACNAF